MPVTTTHQLPSDQKRKRLLKIQTNTSVHYGKKPQERTLAELLSQGCILLDKPCGPTSHQVVSWVRDMLELNRCGHGGTLDPHVTGILPIGLEQGTRTLEVLLSAGKEYVGIMHLHTDKPIQKIKEVCNSFVGEITQKPPVRSAVKRVRRKRTIYYLDIIEIENRDVLFRVGCEAGTYIRTLCVDIGYKLKTKAHMAELRRTRVGTIHEKNTVILQDVKDAFMFYKEQNDESSLRSILLPIERFLDHLPKIVIRDSAVDALCHGAHLALPGVVEVDTNIKINDPVAILSLKGEGIALGKAQMSTEEIIQKDTGICTCLDRVFMNKGTYPPLWKKS